MFTLNDDLSIYATRGDIVFFSVSAEEDGKPYKFQAGDVLRIKVFGKKDAEKVVLQKDFPVIEETEEVEIFLSEEDTKIGEVISKPKDYWYEVELNPYNNPQTIIGYDEDGAKVFKLFPEGDDIPEFVPDPEDIRVMDDELDMTSTRPVQNQAIARAMVSLRADFENVNNLSAATANALYVERARIDNIVSVAAAPVSGDESVYLEVADARVGADGAVFSSAGTAVRTQIKQLSDAINKVMVENIYDASMQTVETITNNAYMQSGALKSNENYFVTAPIDVSHYAGSNLYFNVPLHGSATDSCIVSCFDASGNFLTEQGMNGLCYTVPIGASYIRLTVWKYAYWDIDDVNNAFMLLTANVPVDFFPYGRKFLIPEKAQANNCKMAIDVRNNVLNFTAPSGTKYLHYTMKYFGGSKNAFFDFGSIAEANELSAFPSEETALFSNGSDFFGPYIVKAINNADGDKPTSLNFTGASHAYSGNTEGSTSATGRSEVTAIMVDGVKQEEYSGYCNTLDVYWTNYIQATNTKKEDGTGREVLKEEYHLHFDGKDFEIENDVTAMEAVEIVRYYGLQIAHGVPGYDYSISYVGSHNNVVSAKGNSKSADTLCREIFIRRNDKPVECRFGLHPIGLGTFYCNNWYSAFDTEYGKSYLFMVCPDKSCKMVENQQVNFKGYYKFRYCE